MSTGGVLPGSMTLDHPSWKAQCQLRMRKRGNIRDDSPSYHTTASYALSAPKVSEHRTLLSSAQAHRTFSPGHIRTCSKPTQTHDNAVTKPLGMQHMLVRSHTKVSHHLHRLGILDLDMALLHHRLHEVLVHQLTHRAPQRPILHHQQMRSTCDGIRDERFRPVAVFGAFLVDQLLDDAPVGDDNCSSSAQFERVQPAIFGCPFCESVLVRKRRGI